MEIVAEGNGPPPALQPQKNNIYVKGASGIQQPSSLEPSRAGENTEDESIEELAAIQEVKEAKKRPYKEMQLAVQSDDYHPKKIARKTIDNAEFGPTETSKASKAEKSAWASGVPPKARRPDHEIDDSAPPEPEFRKKKRKTPTLKERGLSPTAEEQVQEPIILVKSHKRKREDRERAASPGSANRGPPFRSVKRSDSPKPILSDIVADEKLAKPVSTIAKSIKVLSEKKQESSLDEHEHTVISTSKNSAFDKKERVIKERKEKARLIHHHGELAGSNVQRACTPVFDKGDSSGNAPRSGRRAAQQANERITSRQEVVIQDQFSKPKKRRAEREARLMSKDKRRRDRDDDSMKSEDEWVQCDACLKWRVLPSSVDVIKLPKHWYCEMNVDPLHNSCDAPEQTAEEIAQAKRKAKRRLTRKARQEAQEAMELANIQEETMETQREPPVTKEYRAERTKEIPRSPVFLKKDSPPKVDEKCIEVSEAKPRRPSPVSSASDSGNNSPRSESSSGDSQKHDTVKKASSTKVERRGRPDETEETPPEHVGESSVPRGRPRGRGRRAGKDVCGKDHDKVKGGKSSSKEAENQEWVQCEKCEKWRRLPPSISSDDLPEVWYCTMNTWDPSNASCDVAEDKADPNTREYTIIGQGNPPPHAGGHKLSYRSLIFGTGKKQNRPVSERMRAAESLFGSHSYDSTDHATHPPTVMYASSSVYISRAQARSGEEPEPEGASFLGLMRHSNLWAELKGISQKMAGSMGYESSVKDVDGSSECTYDELPQNLRQQMKELVFHSLGNGMLASHEVLLHVQCRPWEAAPKLWFDLQAFCTIDTVMAALLDLVKDGRAEAVGDSAMPKFRRTIQPNPVPVLSDEAPPPTRKSKCMKIAKPWKRGVQSSCM